MVNEVLTRKFKQKEENTVDRKVMDQIRDLLLCKEKMMKEYVVEITEVLQHQETVKAHSKNEAINVVREKYKNEDVILNDENITDLRFDVLEVKKKLFDRER